MSKTRDCPRCGGMAHVLRGRPKRRGHLVIRILLCPDCGYRGAEGAFWLDQAAELALELMERQPAAA